MSSATNESMARLEQAIARLGAEHEPPLGWQANVLAAIDADRERSWRGRWIRWLAPAPALALGIVAAALLWISGPDSSSAFLSIRRVSTLQVVRGGEDFLLGDRLGIEAGCGVERCAIRVYRDEQFVVGCPGTGSCRVGGAGVGMDLELDRMGEYVIVAFPVGAAAFDRRGSVDADLDALRGVGIRRRHFIVR